MSIQVYPPFVSTEQSISAPWYLQVARGKVEGVTDVRIFGYQEDVSTTIIPIWENPTAYVYPAVAETMTLYSSNASDTNVRVLIQGLDTNFEVVSEALVLTNGTTGVTTANQYLRINNIINIQGPTYAFPLGILYLSNAAKTTTYAQVNLLDGVSIGKTQASIYTVPAGFTFYLTRVNAYSSENGGVAYSIYSVYSKNNTSGAEFNVLTSPFVAQYDAYLVTPFPYTEKTDIQWQAKMKSGTHEIGMVLEGVLISNTAA